MTVGLPGAGISAFFYLACAFLMPFVALFRMACGRRVDRAAWRTILRQLAIASTVLLVILLTGWFVTTLSTTVAPQSSGEATDPTSSLLRTVSRLAIWLGIGTLLLVLGVVRLLAWSVRRQDRRVAAQRAVGSATTLATPASSDHAGRQPSSAKARSDDRRDDRTSPARGGP